METTPRKKFSANAKLRIFEKHKGTCVLCGVQIIPGSRWILEHMRPLALGGTNDESNLFPVHLECAAAKTNGKEGDNARSALAKRKKIAALGIKSDVRKQGISSRGFPKREKPFRDAALKIAPRRSLYTEIEE